MKSRKDKKAKKMIKSDFSMAINNSLADCSYLVTLHCNEILKSTIYKGVFYISDFRMHFLHCVAIFITYLIEQNQGKL